MGRTSACVAIASLVLAAHSAVAFAQQPIVPQNGPIVGSSPAAPRWYGWQALAIDATAALVPYVAYRVQPSSTLAGESAPVAAINVTAPIIFLAGGPIIHAAHHQYRRMGLSLALRVLLPVIGGLIGQSHCAEGCDTFLSVTGGALVGGGIAALVDDVGLGWDQRLAP
jgi:hypothetical protein